MPAEKRPWPKSESRGERLWGLAGKPFGNFNLPRGRRPGRTEETRPTLVIVDSVQTLTSMAAEGSCPAMSTRSGPWPRACSKTCRATDTTLVLVGHHVTKDGALAGPRLLEHMVDTVIFAGRRPPADVQALARFSRTVLVPMRNCFVFTWGKRDGGYRRSVHIFLGSARPGPFPGRPLSWPLTARRPLAVEVQALANRTF